MLTILGQLIQCYLLLPHIFCLNQLSVSFYYTNSFLFCIKKYYLEIFFMLQYFELWQNKIFRLWLFSIFHIKWICKRSSWHSSVILGLIVTALLLRSPLGEINYFYFPTLVTQSAALSSTTQHVERIELRRKEYEHPWHSLRFLLSVKLKKIQILKTFTKTFTFNATVKL